MARHPTLPVRESFKPIRARQKNVRSRTCLEDRFLQAICGAACDRHFLDHGATIVVRHAQGQMLQYEKATTPLLDLCNASGPGLSYLERQIGASTVIVGLIRAAKAQTTTDDIVAGLFAHYKLDTTASGQYTDIARHLVFANIGWISMLYTAKLELAELDFAINDASSTQNTTGKGQLAQSSRRPLGALLRRFGLMPIGCPPGVFRDQENTDLLAVTHMNFFSLSTLGDVTVVWTNDLSRHCEFDRYSRNKELRLFRMPSLCAMMCLDARETLLGSLFRSHTCQNNCHSTGTSVSKAFLGEVLLSYRLLFGQHQRSRQCFREKERGNASCNGMLDPLLDALCGEKTINDLGGVQDLLRERGVYNPKTNFPHLGARLLELEDYSTDQRPRNLWEVWNDERDPERYLTFRAVLLVGGLSVLLSFIQIVVAVVQIVV